jgi:hypothetical protein
MPQPLYRNAAVNHSFHSPMNDLDIGHRLFFSVRKRFTGDADLIASVASVRSLIADNALVGNT